MLKIYAFIVCFANFYTVPSSNFMCELDREESFQYTFLCLASYLYFRYAYRSSEHCSRKIESKN